jgi:hypothetical protein
MNRLRGKPTYSNVMVTVLAVLVLGGGTAYAATEMLPKNSVGPKQIKKEAVTPAKLSRASKATLTGPKGATGATGATGPQGPPGAKGEKGDQGPQGPGAVTIEDAATATPRGVATFGGVTISDQCDGGTATIELSASTGSDTVDAFGTYTETGTVHGETSSGFGGVEAFGATAGWDVEARNTAVGDAWYHFDLGMTVSDCKLWGVVTPSTIG